jgi:hypothetical protein
MTDEAGGKADLAPAIARFESAVEQALATHDFNAVSPDDLRRVMTAAVRLYAAQTEETGEFPSPVARDRVTPTEVVIAVCEMMRAADLNMFDLNMWFGRVRPE